MVKWEQKAINMNFKKAVIIFLITGFVLMIAVPATLYGNFQNRLYEWEQSWETDRNENGKDGNMERKGGNPGMMTNMVQITGSRRKIPKRKKKKTCEIFIYGRNV